MPHGHVKIKNVLVVPILYRGEAIGMIKVAHKKEGYGDYELEMLENIAEVVAPVLLLIPLTFVG